MRKKSGDARRAVLEAATVAFARKGYAGTSVADILEAAGLSKPTLYYYFNNKEGLFRAILDFAFDEPYRLMREAAAGEAGTESKLVTVAAVLFEFCGTHQNLTRLALSASFAAPEEVPAGSVDAAKRRRNFEFIRGIILEGQKQGDLDKTRDSSELAHGIYGSLSHQIRMHLLAPGGRLDRKRAEKIVSLFMEGARRRDRKK